MAATAHPVFDVSRTVALKNTHCPYCGANLAKVKANKDHVIARKLVPKGAFAGQWNLALRACATCNQRKAGLEDDLSAILMTMRASWPGDSEDESLRLEALRKAPDSISRKTGRPVADSHERVRLHLALQTGATLSLGLIAPPQIEPDRAFELARLQLMGFFCMLTYAPDARRGFFWPHGFHPLHCAGRSDWGHVVLRDFATATRDWHHRLALVTAHGDYRARIRKHPESELWAWAIEWNRIYRLVGFFGERDAAQSVVDNIRQPIWRIMHDRNGSVSRFSRLLKNSLLAQPRMAASTKQTRKRLIRRSRVRTGAGLAT